MDVGDGKLEIFPFRGLCGLTIRWERLNRCNIATAVTPSPSLHTALLSSLHLVRFSTLYRLHFQLRTVVAVYSHWRQFVRRWEMCFKWTPGGWRWHAVPEKGLDILIVMYF